jgi:hypothetical protein
MYVYIRMCFSMKMGPIGCAETSVDSYQHMLCNIPEERRPQIHILYPIIFCVSLAVLEMIEQQEMYV